MRRGDRRWIRDGLLRLVRKNYLGRDHYRDSEGYFVISKNIQPVVNAKALIPVDFATITVVVAGGVANAVIWPGAASKEVWEILAVTASHNDTADKDGEFYYQGNNGTVRLAHDALVKNLETLVYPVFHDETALTHDHIIDIGPLLVSREHTSRATVRLSATNGKVLTVNYAYRRVL